MPTRRRKPTDPPEPESSGRDEEEPIEILEVVGVDETTGSVKKGTAPVATPPGRAAPPPEPGGDTHARQLEEALRDKDKYYDLLLRKQAEFDNYRKRTERERAESGLAGAREVLQRLLPVLDNMERALRTGGASSSCTSSSWTSSRRRACSRSRRSAPISIRGCTRRSRCSMSRGSRRT